MQVVDPVDAPAAEGRQFQPQRGEACVPWTWDGRGRDFEAADYDLDGRRLLESAL